MITWREPAVDARPTMRGIAARIRIFIQPGPPNADLGPVTAEVLHDGWTSPQIHLDELAYFVRYSRPSAHARLTSKLASFSPGILSQPPFSMKALLA